MTSEEIEELKGLAASMGLYDDKNPCKRAVILGKAIKALEQEPREGHWHRQTNDYVDYYECSECGMAIGLYDVKNYCPNCGSRNEVEE